MALEEENPDPNEEEQGEEEEEEEEVVEEPKGLPAPVKFLWEGLKAQWFLVGIACCILFAYLFPSLNSTIKGPIIQKYVAVPIIFFNAGMTLKTNELKRVLANHKLVHAYIQGFSLGLLPISMFFLMKLLGEISDSILQHFREGFVVLGALPTTIAMQVILTQKSRANVTIAVVSAALGNLLGIFITPIYLFILIDRDESVSPPVLTVLINLLLSVFLPLCVGQAVRNFFPGFVKKFTSIIKPSTLNCCILIFMVWTSFSKTFNSDLSLGWFSFFQLITAAIILYCFYFGLSFLLTSLLGFPPSVRVPSLYGSTQKTISIGIPFINILFEGDPSIAFYSLPLLFYHPFQLIFGTLISGRFRKWVEETDEGGDEEEGENVPEEEVEIELEGFENENCGEEETDCGGGEIEVSKGRDFELGVESEFKDEDLS